MSASGTKAGKKHTAPKASEGPSAKSLKAIPELSPDAVFLGRGPEGMRMAQGLTRAIRRGRPPKGEQAEGTSTRTVRLPEGEWAALDWLSKQRGITPHAAMREAIVHWLAREGGKLPRDAKQAAKVPAKPAAKAKPTRRAHA